MAKYEYKVVPAPSKGTKAKGVKTPEGRFAVSVEEVLNRMGADGWEYLRAELLPSDERSGLTGTTTNWRNVLVFRRLLEGNAALAPAPLATGAAFAAGVPATSAFAPPVGPANADEGNAPPVFASRTAREPVEDETADDDQAESAESEPRDEDNRALSGIEKVMRRRAVQSSGEEG